jgi:hypothetical protein
VLDEWSARRRDAVEALAYTSSATASRISAIAEAAADETVPNGRTRAKSICRLIALCSRSIGTIEFSAKPNKQQ